LIQAGGIKIEDTFEFFLDPKKSFNSAFKVGIKGDEIILGKYSPTLDCIALLADTEKFGLEYIVKDVLGTSSPLEKTTHYHELGGHVYLTKRSSYWTMLFLNNFNSFLGFSRMLGIVEAGLVETKLERLRKDALDLIAMNEADINNHNNWRYLQETVANIYLLGLKKLIEDANIKNTIESLVKENSAKSQIIKDLTRLSEFILDEIGVKIGWQILASMALHASSPDLFKDFLNKNPDNFEDVKKIKKDALEKSMDAGIEGFKLGDPTYRFMEMINVADKCIDEIKKSIKRSFNPGDISYGIANICGFEINMLENQTDQLIDQIKSITNEKVMPDEARRDWQLETVKFLNFFKVMQKSDNPTFWFINDMKSGKISYSASMLTSEHRESGSYLVTDVLKYQFLKSLESGEDCIVCFEKKVSFCESQCELCKVNKGFKIAKELYQIMSDFSYEEMRREALDKNRIIKSLLS